MRRRDAGFTTLEVVVAMVLFGVLATAVAGLLVNAVDLTRDTTQRTTAAGIARAQIERVRGMSTMSVPDGGTASAVTVAGTTYAVRQTTNVLPADSPSSVCQGSGNQLAYKLVTVEVTWDGMGSTQPVRSDTLKALTLTSGIDPRRGTAAVAVLDGDGQPQRDVHVVLSPSGTRRTTGGDGCAVFLGLDPSTTYTATATRVGSVAPDGSASAVSAGIGIRAGAVTRTSVGLAAAGALRVEARSPSADYPVPQGLGVTVSHPVFSPSPDRAFPDCLDVPTAPSGCVSGTPRTAAALFPGTYAAWAGTCSDARPAAPRAGQVRPGGVTDVVSDLGGVRAQVVGPAPGEVRPGSPLYARHAPVAGCPTGETWSLAPVGLEHRAALPPGEWTLSTTPDGSGAPPTGWPTVVVTPGSVPPDVTPVSVP